MATPQTARRKHSVRPPGAALRTFERRGARLLARAERRAERYLSVGQRRALRKLGKHAQGLRAEIGAFLRHSTQAFEKRAELMVARINPGAARQMRRALKTLGPAKGGDLRRLEQRLSKVERRVVELADAIAQLQGRGAQPTRPMRAVR